MLDSNPRAKAGFTLIELLVVIGIIALLSAVVFAALSEARKKARDGQRIANARQLAIALEQYETSKGTYTVANAGYQNTGSGFVGKMGVTDYTTSIISSLKSSGFYSSDILKDPIYGDDNYYLGMCTSTNAYSIYLKTEQSSLNTATSTLLAACDGANAVAQGFNYIASFGGGGGTAQAGGGGGGGGFVATTNIDGPVATSTFAASTVVFSWMLGIPNTPTTDNVPTLSWSAPVNNSGSPITGYKIYRSTTPGTETFYQAVGNVLSYKDDGAVRKSKNYYKITAINALGEGNQGTEIVADVTAGEIGTYDTFTGTGVNPIGLAFDGTNIYSANYTGNTISKITKSGVISQFTTTSGSPFNLAYYGGYLHVTASAQNFVYRYNMSGTYVDTIVVNSSPVGIAFADGNVCTANAGAANMSIVEKYGLNRTFTCATGNIPRGIATDMRGSLWITDSADDRVSKISAGCARVTYNVGDNPYAIAHDGNNMWVANFDGNSVTKISVAGTVLGTYALPAGSNPHAITFDGTNVWTANAGTNSISRITSSGVVTTFPVPGPAPKGIVFDGTSIWVANTFSDSVSRVVIK